MRKIKLFCLPYAGGSSVTYIKWGKLLNRYIEVIEVELPGRGRRINDPLIDNLEDMVEDVFRFIKDQLTGDYAIFGHSMGGLITDE
ncbi:thioesterase II family protein [Lysinibacillus sphaericus]|uniref:thioesterase II family protein n=1 Tax=Lysinibacillus sphaericus TaxID=1421 RepID=UPI0018CE9D0A|nr:alpha/beta fold hydrolase [Lysinibacillus sphaericus]